MRCRLRGIAVVALTLIVSLAWTSPVAAAVPNGVSRYVPRDREANRAKIEAGVKEAIAELSFLIRPFARRKLDPDQFDIGLLEFEVTPTVVTIRHDGHVTTTPSTGVRVPFVEDGEKMHLSQRVEDDRIVQTFASSSGTLHLSYEFAEDGSSVSVRAALESPKLPRQLQYVLIFDRA